MSIASECDLCGAFFRSGKGNVCLDVHIDTGGTGYSSSWTDVDFCGKCSAKVLKLIQQALDKAEDVE